MIRTLLVYVVGIAGGSGSGKTTIANALVRSLPAGSVTTISHDCYYRHRPELPASERAQINFDHPTALDNALLARHLDELRCGDAVELPVYDYATHLRSEKTTPTTPTPVVILEGILVLTDPVLRSRLDLKIYVDTDADIRVLRRIKRDVSERGRTFDQVYDQYHSTVRPMHLEFVEPSRRFADLAVVEGGATEVAIDTVVAKLLSMIEH